MIAYRSARLVGLTGFLAVSLYVNYSEKLELERKTLKLERLCGLSISYASTFDPQFRPELIDICGDPPPVP